MRLGFLDERREERREEQREREADVFYDAWCSGLDPDAAVYRYQESGSDQDPRSFVASRIAATRRRREALQEDDQFLDEQQEEEEG